MNIKKFYLANLVALALCFGANVAQAQTYSYFPEGAGPYFRVGVGPSFFQNGQINNFGGLASGRVEYKTGFATDVAVGYAFNKYLATDFELGVDGAEINNVPGYDSHNSYLYNFPFLANVMLSCPIPHSIVTPYIGVGVGGDNSVFDTDRFTDTNTGNWVSGNENDVVFACQAFAGLRFQLNSRMSFGIGYKYFATGNPTYSYPPSPNFDVGFRGTRTHSVLFTFQMNFW
jgi:opacity protein-like surface antigen